MPRIVTIVLLAAASVAAIVLIPAARGEIALPSWLADRAEDAQWLTEEGERPRAIIDLWANGVEVVLYLPDLDPKQVVDRIEVYDIWNQTDMVESSFCADGAFFTGSRLTAPGIDVFSPTVTWYLTSIKGSDFEMKWGLMSKESASEYVLAHRSEMEATIRAAGIEDTVDDYLAETVERLGVIASVTGSHRYRGGFYSYRQEIHSANTFHEELVQRFGARPQLRAALKSALFSVGQFELAGPRGEKGTKFDLRGGSYSSIRPGT